MLQFKAVGLNESDALEIQLNGVTIPDTHIARHYYAEGQNEWQGRELPAYWLYIVDLDYGRRAPPLINGDNQLTIGFAAREASGEGIACIDELEVYIYVRQPLDA